ncbi:MAG TPA: hypothetical protein VHB20_10855 [Verrucomicrobiae bacterium]|jgi:hypothetical protein|nr:hypothetical protein [Verrucomicrobiae bacterium]
MRTKTLVLTALSSLSAIGLMAQTSTNVYSLNAVGYINVAVPQGFSIIADQLWANTSGSNAIGQVLVAPQDGSLDGSKLYKFSGAKYHIYTMDSGIADSWDPIASGPDADADPGAHVTLNPGEGAFFLSAAPATFTFVGTVPQGTNSIPLHAGFNLISSAVPQAGGVTSTLGFPIDFSAAGSQDGDKLYTFDHTAGYHIYTVDSGDASGWQSGQEPHVLVGQGFFYLTTASGPSSWTRVFSVNQ